MISVILPATRPQALACCLTALRAQTLAVGWEVVVVDDTEEGEAIRQVSLAAFSTFPLWTYQRYLRASPPRTGSFVAGRARNIGVANAAGSLMVFVDADVMLAPDALEHYAAAYERHGDNTIIIGLYHWLSRMDFGPDDVEARFDEILYQGLTQAEAPFARLPMDEPGLQGRDPREGEFSNDVDALVENASLGSWTGNVAYPRDLFIRVGGFDETIRGHGGEDADLALSAYAAGANFLQYGPIWGVHRWHPRNQERNAQEVQENIAYIDRKHGVGQYADAPKVLDAQDWRASDHYTKDLGAVLLRPIGDGTVYACREKHCIGLPSPEWVAKLGFSMSDVLELPRRSIEDRYTLEGVAK